MHYNGKPGRVSRVRILGKPGPGAAVGQGIDKSSIDWRNQKSTETTSREVLRSGERIYRKYNSTLRAHKKRIKVESKTPENSFRK